MKKLTKRGVLMTGSPKCPPIGPNFLAPQFLLSTPVSLFHLFQISNGHMTRTSQSEQAPLVGPGLGQNPRPSPSLEPFLELPEAILSPLGKVYPREEAWQGLGNRGRGRIEFPAHPWQTEIQLCLRLRASPAFLSCELLEQPL